MARAPLPGWKPRSFGDGMFIDLGACQITVDNYGDWSIDLEAVGSIGGLLAPAQLAAEDAVRSLVDEMAAALGGRVVWGECSSLCAPGERCMVTDSGRCDLERQAETAATAAAGEVGR